MLMVPMDSGSAARGRFMYMMFLFVVFMMFSPSPPNPYRLLALEAQAAREKHSLEILRNATFRGAFEVPRGLNVTGVRSTHGLSDSRQILLFQNMLDDILIHFLLNRMKRNWLTMVMSREL
jgi:hypothetical protein